ncbi:MAG: hypothetical protein Q4B01_03945 [Eubacteriales bacterium]|nr:hypothetical protein [Eubacteriales bacterium]
MSNLARWAAENGLSSLYEEYKEDVDDLKIFYGSHTDDLELAVSQLQKNDYYAELFGE